MIRFLERVGFASFDGLGRCIYCMRGAFFSAIGCWILTSIILAIMPYPLLAAAAAILASALTILWLSHLAAYAVRAAPARAASAIAGGSLFARIQGRREFLRSFARAFVAVAFASAFVGMARPASAQGNCPSGTPAPCGTNYCCAAPARFYCQGYSGLSEPWRSLVNFCTNVTSTEDIADLRSNCAFVITC